MALESLIKTCFVLTKVMALAQISGTAVLTMRYSLMIDMLSRQLEMAFGDRSPTECLNLSV